MNQLEAVNNPLDYSELQLEAVNNPFDYSELLFHPNLTPFLDFYSLIKLRLINRRFNYVIDNTPEVVDFWKCMCTSYSFYHGLFTPAFLPRHENIISDKDYKKHFSQQLLKINAKWSNGEYSSDQAYQIEVVSRFRPGQRGNEKMFLPLGQFLKVKRRVQSNKIKDASNNKEYFVGEPDPEEFLDPFLGILMRDPVLLTSSNRIVERSIALQCILRGGKDPFNNQKLTTVMLESQTELKNRILEWRIRKENSDVRVGMGEVKTLVDDFEVDPQLLDALIEIERLQQIANRAATDAYNSHNVVHNDEQNAEVGLNNQDPPVAVIEEIQNENEIEPNQILNDENNITDNQNNSIQLMNNFIAPMNTITQINDVQPRKVESAHIVDINSRNSSVIMHVPGAGVRPFYFSHVFDENANQVKVYEDCAADAVANVLNGFNSCVMCYGQTGAGKTHTFFGPDGAMESIGDCIRSGIVPMVTGVVVRACMDLLSAKECMGKRGISLTITAQFIEIYEEQAIDLLTGRNVNIRRETGEVVGAHNAVIDSIDQMVHLLESGHARKRFASTAMNDRSSRSHTALIVQVMQKINQHEIKNFSCKEELKNRDQTNDKLIKSNLHLIDLAGSERIKKSLATGNTMREAVGINSSLFVLAKVISALTKGNAHVPYYESKLTTLLKGAFGGNSRTTAIINCRSDDVNSDETLESLRFGERCGMISNQMRQMASSYSSTMETIDKALHTFQSQIISLEARGKQHLTSYKNLVNSYHELEKKKNELLHMNGKLK
eukprot:gene6489-8922_t